MKIITLAALALALAPASAGAEGSYLTKGEARKFVTTVMRGACNRDVDCTGSYVEPSTDCLRRSTRTVVCYAYLRYNDYTYCAVHASVTRRHNRTLRGALGRTSCQKVGTAAF